MLNIFCQDPPRILYKARCLARGDIQRPYIEFEPEVLYAPVETLDTIRIVLENAAAQSLILETMNVSSAYLYGYFVEPRIMEQLTNYSGSSFVLEKLSCSSNRYMEQTRQVRFGDQ